MSQSARLVQSGEGDRRFVVLLYLIHPDRDPALRKALGPKPMILARADDGDPGPGIQEDAGSYLKMHSCEMAGLVLGGWSAGCSGVRKRLLELEANRVRGIVCPNGRYELERLRALVLADGTHASLPPQAWQLDVWRPWVEKAREGETCTTCDGEGEYWTGVEGHGCREMAPCKECAGSGRSYPFVFAAAHTYQTYVERLPSGQAYTSTVNVLRALTGWPLERAKSDPVAARSDHGLHVESWDSAVIDGAAHVRQQKEALPGMLARYVRPMVEAAIL